MIPDKLSALTGNWKGTNRLNLSWMPDPIKESDSTAVVTKRVGGQCLEIAYVWEYEGKSQEGLIIISANEKSAAAKAAWTDSWHSANVLMICDGTISDKGVIDLKGFYSAQEGPDWGWRTQIIPEGDSFKYLMFNVTPDDEEEWAVETEFTRV